MKYVKKILVRLILKSEGSSTTTNKKTNNETKTDEIETPDTSDSVSEKDEESEPSEHSCKLYL